MQLRTSRLIGMLAILALCVPALAQFGHPLKGSWSGEWWLKKGDDSRILLDFDWDGKALKGMLNPGTDNVTVTNLTLQPPPINDVSKAMDPWLLHFEADMKDASGKVTRLVVDGKLQNIGAYARFITGTWSIGGQKAEFRVVRN